MKEIELQKLRKKREKHFLQQNGNIIAKIYDDDVHFFKNGKYEEIDNTLISIPNGYINKENDYHVSFYDNQNYLMKMEKEQFFLNVKLENINSSILLKENEDIYYKNILNDVDLKYQVKSNKVKEEIVLKNNPSTDKLSFIIETNLNLKLQNKEVYALDGENIVFSIDAPFMYDSNGKFNDNLYYLLNIVSKNVYKLDLYLDNIWLNGDDISYPVIIDPTITNRGEENNVYDTYIYPGDTNVNRNNQDILKVGVGRVNGVDVVNRALIKFQLPEIETGSQVVQALMQLVGYPVLNYGYQRDYVSVHRITTDWDETTAKWDTMNDKYDTTYTEGGFLASRSNMDSAGNVVAYDSVCDITKLVKRWYTDTPNYGLMLKLNKEVYKGDIFPSFFSKNNTATGDNPKPILEVTYRNHNGLEKYLNYKTQDFTRGKSYINTYNGNLTTSFNIGATIGGKLPASLDIFYNTNDVILEKDYGYGVGYKLNFNQTIEEYPIEGIVYLKYIDEDGTIHYFYPENDIFKDEDGLEFTITKANDEYILKDTDNNQRKFTIVDNVGYLTKVVDSVGTEISIQYENGKISKIIDGNNQEINILYIDNMISIMCPDQNIYLNYVDSKLNSIETITGNTLFAYNSNNIIDSITDENQKKVKYDYYEQPPYRLKKLTEYGVNNGSGECLDIIFDNDSTSIMDNKNRTTSVVFNDYGNPVSITYLKSKDNIKDAYGNFENYGNYDQYLNEVAANGIPIKYVENYLKNTSFENEKNNFSIIGSIETNVVSEDANTGKRSLKAIKSNVNNFISQLVQLEKGEFYTFSCYIKSDCSMRLSLSYLNNNGDLIEKKGQLIDKQSNFKRSDVTIFYPTDALSDLELKIYFETAGTAYIEDVQLEKGEVANDYNLLDNSDFSDGFDEWVLTAYDENGPGISTDGKFEVVTLENGNKALKIKMDWSFSTSLAKTFDIEGKAGDSYFLTFWYKNEGTPVYPFDTTSVVVKYNFVDQTMGTCFTPPKLNCNKDNWQFFSHVFIADKDFKSLTVEFKQGNNANNLYITNLNLFKDARYNKYEYDTSGKIIGFKGYDNNQITFDYDKNNKLIKMTTPKGGNFKFEYDNIKSDRLLNKISATGIVNQTKYDDFGNPMVTKIINSGINKELINSFYKIRLKGTNEYLRYCEGTLFFGNSDCNHDLWLLEKVDDCYKIKHSILERYLSVLDNNPKLLSSNYLFCLVKTDEGSYLIKNADNKYFYNNNGTLCLGEYIEEDNNFKFYFESIDHDLFIENSASYTEDGRFIETTVDSLLNKTVYETDLITGLIKSITNPKNHKVSYEYNSKRQLTKVINGVNDILYTYNANNLLEKITENNKEYHFDYDEFLNLKSINIGNNIKLVEYLYEDNNGDLLSMQYGNGHNVNFQSDEFGKTKSIIKMDDTYNYKYNFNGELAKIVSNDLVQKYIYDTSKNLSEYVANDFKIQYTYDENNNVINKQCSKNDFNYNMINQFNDDNSITQVTFDDSNITYDYDFLGRVINKQINDIHNMTYEYVTNGKRTSLLVKSIKYNDEEYRCVYDELYNITHLYHNNELINKYYYNEYNELVAEDNYLINQTIRYVYDTSGNILKKQLYDLENEVLISENIYQYTNNNWLDQLTKFNDDNITYDEIGNPITIGNKILSWVNGRELYSYNDNNNSIVYKYNNEGIRTSKNVNGKEIKYYLEENKIILEDRGDAMLYYMYGGSDVIGFSYNNNKYYYIKNLLNDVIGIIDENGTTLVEYCYDSWGNIISMIDNTTDNIGIINPYRYRSYYYDVETNLYYLNFRYYNPVWGRFLNADAVIGTTNYIYGNNLYVYCGNNPVSKKDESGESSFIAALLISAMVGTLVSVTSLAISNTINSMMSRKKRKSSWQEYVATGIGGAAGGVTSLFGGPCVSSAVSEGVSTFATEILNHLSGEQEITSAPRFVYNVVRDATLGGAYGLLPAKIPGISKGRGNFGAVYKAGITKLRRNIVKNMSANVMLKGAVSQLFESALPIAAGGILGYFEDSIEDFARKSNIDVRWDY